MIDEISRNPMARYGLIAAGVTLGVSGLAKGSLTRLALAAGCAYLVLNNSSGFGSHQFAGVGGGESRGSRLPEGAWLDRVRGPLHGRNPTVSSNLPAVDSGPANRPDQAQADLVEEASEESFPASDPPSYTR